MTALIDFVALFFAISIGYQVSGSWPVALGAGALVALYGFWCFYDGTQAGGRHE